VESLYAVRHVHRHAGLVVRDPDGSGQQRTDQLKGVIGEPLLHAGMLRGRDRLHRSDPKMARMTTPPTEGVCGYNRALSRVREVIEDTRHATKETNNP
jgi:hypothetical protein